jgi:2-polyprenyl-3-methyl-5-hydroxy-6-metoxy-1,4-benzoquinol methylase
MHATAPPTRAVRFLCSEYGADKLAVLDVGCGRGEHLAYFGQGSLGLDAVEANVEAVRARGLEAQLANVEDELPDLDRRFDAAYCSNIIEHLVSPHLLLLRLHQALTPNGLVFIMVPTIPPARPLDWLIRRVIGHNGYLAAEHVYAFTPRTAEFMVERAGYRVLETAFVAARGGRLLRPLEPIFKEIGISALVVARRDPTFVYPEKRVKQFTPGYMERLDQRD